MSELEKLEAYVATLKNEKGKPVDYRMSFNKWIVQVILDNEWTTVYHAVPPQGTPEYIAPNLFVAKLEALQKAVEKFEFAALQREFEKLQPK